MSISVRLPYEADTPQPLQGPSCGPNGKARLLIANDPTTPDVQQKQQDRKRKRKAILAGGVVLGLGAAVTLAAWSDDVFANGTFTTGQFELVGNVYGTPAGYGEHDESPGGDLTFVVSPANMAPGDTVYAPISIATSVPSTTGATVAMLGGTAAPGDLFSALRYSVAVTATAGVCNAASFTGSPTLLVPADSPLTTAGTAAFEVGSGQTDPEHLCFAVTLPNAPAANHELQGETTDEVVWEFNGTSLAS